MTYLPLWDNVANYLQGTKLRKQLAFPIISSTPSPKTIAQNLNPLFLAESTYFHRFPGFFLSRRETGSRKCMLEISYLWKRTLEVDVDQKMENATSQVEVNPVYP